MKEQADKQERDARKAKVPRERGADKAEKEKDDARENAAWDARAGERQKQGQNNGSMQREPPPRRRIFNQRKDDTTMVYLMRCSFEGNLIQ